MKTLVLIACVLPGTVLAQDLAITNCTPHNSVLKCQVENTSETAVGAFTYSAYAIEDGRSFPWNKINGSLEIAGGLEPNEVLSLEFPLPEIPTRAVGRVISYHVTSVPTKVANGDFKQRLTSPSILSQHPDNVMSLSKEVSSCWNRGSLSTEASRTAVTIGIALDANGKVDKSSLTLQSSIGGSDAATKQAYEAGRRAILMCEKGGFATPDHTSRTFFMTFLPSGEITVSESD